MPSGSIHKAHGTLYIQAPDKLEYGRPKESAPTEFLAATYIFLQIQLGNTCFIHFLHHEFSRTE